MTSMIEEKSVDFALRIIKLSRYLNDRNEYVLSKQILRSGTSIGANIAEAVYARSSADFLSKRTIALCEARETAYWLLLLHESGCITDVQYTSLKKDCEELIAIMVSSIKTIKENNE